MGRLVFAGAGFGGYIAAAVGAVAAQFVRGGGLALQIVAITLGCLPWALGIGLIVMRVRRGKQWRWLSYFGGMFFLPLLAVLAVLAVGAWQGIRNW